jgi:hypothetical protein
VVAGDIVTDRRVGRLRARGAETWHIRQSGPHRRRENLDLVRYCFAVFCALGLAAIGIARRVMGGPRSLIVLVPVAVLFAAFYVAIVILQVKLTTPGGHKRNQQNG